MWVRHKDYQKKKNNPNLDELKLQTTAITKTTYGCSLFLDTLTLEKYFLYNQKGKFNLL